MVVNRNNVLTYLPYAKQLAPYAAAAYQTAFQAPKPNGGLRVGMGYRHGQSFTRTLRSTKWPKTQRSFKKAVDDTKPAKHFTAEPLVGPALHNNMYTYNVTSKVTQGDGNQNRDGDAITLCALKIKNAYFTDTAGGAYQCRMIVGYSGEEYNASGYSSSLLSSGEIFQPDTYNWTINGVINPKAFTVLYDGVIDSNSQIDGTRDVAGQTFMVDLGNTRFLYQASGSVYGKTKNLYVIVICAVGGGTDLVTLAGVINTSIDLIYK